MLLEFGPGARYGYDVSFTSVFKATGAPAHRSLLRDGEWATRKRDAEKTAAYASMQGITFVPVSFAAPTARPGASFVRHIEHLWCSRAMRAPGENPRPSRRDLNAFTQGLMQVAAIAVASMVNDRMAVWTGAAPAARHRRRQRRGMRGRGPQLQPTQPVPLPGLPPPPPPPGSRPGQQPVVPPQLPPLPSLPLAPVEHRPLLPPERQFTIPFMRSPSQWQRALDPASGLTQPPQWDLARVDRMPLSPSQQAFLQQDFLSGLPLPPRSGVKRARAETTAQASTETKETKAQRRKRKRQKRRQKKKKKKQKKKQKKKKQKKKKKKKKKKRWRNEQRCRGGGGGGGCSSSGTSSASSASSASTTSSSSSSSSDCSYSSGDGAGGGGSAGGSLPIPPNDNLIINLLRGVGSRVQRGQDQSNSLSRPPALANARGGWRRQRTRMSRRSVLTRTDSRADADSADTGARASAVASPADSSGAPLTRTGSHTSTDSTDAVLLEAEAAWIAVGAPGAPAGRGTPPRTHPATRSQGRLSDPAVPWCTPLPPPRSGGCRSPPQA